MRSCGGPDLELAARVVDEPVALLAPDAGMAAELFNLAGRGRGPLNDCMIAATALRAGASVATTNLTDFRRFEPAGLRVMSSGRARIARPPVMARTTQLEPRLAEALESRTQFERGDRPCAISE